MHLVLCLASVLFIVLILVDGFEAMLQPRRVTRRFRPARMFFRTSWSIWRMAAGWFRVPRRREAFLALYGPLSLLSLFAMWVVSLIFGFALLNWSLATALSAESPGTPLLTYFYLSGVTFFTLGYGEITPVQTAGRFLAVVEAGIGFGFAALIIAYLPTLYQAFSRREQTIGLLDARAGSPPTAGELLRRMASSGKPQSAASFLQEWERWAAEMLESHLSFPVLCYYRSQHDNQSWLAAMTTVLDVCSLILIGGKESEKYQAQLTFAMTRHAAVDLSMVFWIPPQSPPEDRFPPERLAAALQQLQTCGAEGTDFDKALKKSLQLRQMYEPFLHGLSRHFLFTMPHVFPDKAVIDNWQTSAWMKRVPGLANLAAIDDEHFH